MAMDLPYGFDGLRPENDEVTSDRASQRSRTPRRAAALLTLMFFVGLLGGVIAGAEGDPAATEIHWTLW